MSKPLRLIMMFLLTLVGLLDSIWLLSMHSGASSALCEAGRLFSCKALENTQYSQWFSFPVPIFSIGFYTALLFLIVVLKLKRVQDDVLKLIRVFTWLGIAVSIYFALISIFVVRSLCVFCTVLYVVNILLFWVCSKFKEDESFDLNLKSLMKSKFIWISAFVFAFVVGVLMFVHRHQKRLSGQQFAMVGEAMRTYGSPSAPFVITKFSDFQCPACKHAANVLKAVVQESQGRASLVYKFYPLDFACNDQIPKGHGHTHACQSARAAFCASVQDRFWLYHDVLFLNQDLISDTMLREAAQGSQLNMQQFNDCMQSKASLQAIEANIKEGQKLSLQGTPTIFINGKKYDGPLTLESILQTLQ